MSLPFVGQGYACAVRSRGRSGHHRAARGQDVQPSARARPHAQGAGAAPVPPRRQRPATRARATSRSTSAAASSSASSGATAPASRRCSSASPASTPSTSGDIYVDGRMSTFIELGVGFNMDLPARDNVMINGTLLGALAARGGAPVRARHGLRRAVAVRRPQAQELLVGDARAARVRGDDPGRRRHPADRRGARGRRRRLPAEVLRGVRAHPRVRRHGTARHARHGRRPAVLRPRDPARARRGHRERRPAARRQPIPRGQLREGPGARRPERRRRTGSATGAPTSSRAGSRTSTGSARARSPTGRPCTFVARVRFREAVENPIFGVVFQNSRRDTVFTANTLATDPEPGMFAAGEEVTFRLSFDLVFAPDRYTRHARGCARRYRDRMDRPPRPLRVRDGDGHPRHRRHRRARAPDRQSSARRRAGPRRGRRMTAEAAAPPGRRDRRADRARGRPAAALAPHATRSRSPTSSFASSALCSATCGS